MTVKELIEKLQQCNPDAIVYRFDSQYSSEDSVDAVYDNGDTVVIDAVNGVLGNIV